MKNIAELCQAAHAQSAKSGFWMHDEGCAGDVPAVFGQCKCDNLSIDMKIALIHSEISEALEEYRLSEAKRGGPLGAVLYKGCLGTDDLSKRKHSNEACHRQTIADDSYCDLAGKHKPEGFLTELADVVIRVFDLTGRLKLGSEIELDFNSRYTGSLEFNFAHILSYAHYETTRVWSAARNHHRDAHAGELVGRITNLLLAISELADLVHGNLDEAIKIKMAYNATREHKHGKVC